MIFDVRTLFDNLRAIPNGSATIQAGSGNPEDGFSESSIEQDLVEIEVASSDSSAYSNCESPKFFPVKQIEETKEKSAKKRKADKKILPAKKLKQNYSFTIID